MSSAPARVGRYRLIRLLGQGGMGDVFEAMLEGPGGFEKRVALKVLRSEATADAGAREALAREAKLGALLRHPNLVDVYEFGEADGQLFIAMELVEGPTMETLLKDALISPRAALEVGRQACAGLAHAHDLQVGGASVGLVHRDLKPSNLLIDRSGLVKIADLGIARLGGHQTGRIEGTRGYMSPEQCEGEEADGRSDLFSLGLVIWSLLTGSSPLRRSSPMATFLATSQVDTLMAAPGALDPVDAACPGLGDVIAKCLRYRAEERWQDARSLGKALRRLERQATGMPLLDYVLDDDLDHDTALWVQAPSPDTVALALPSHEVTLAPLPQFDDRFVGREAECAQLAAAVASARVVTVKGTAGVGKSRLARVVAGGLDRVAHVDLSAADSALGLLQRVGDALGHALGEGSDQTLGDQLVQFLLRQRGLVLLLDDADRVLDVLRDQIPDWTARDLTVLVTSREALGVPGEVVVELAPMTSAEAMALFVDRSARSLRPGERTLVEELLEGLDGLPLAIELAAARAQVLPVDQLLGRMRDRFDLLHGGGSGRGSTMRGTLALSWELLTPAEQVALSQLSVFEGGFAGNAAESVIDASAVPDAPWPLDLVEALLSRSMLWTRTVDGAVRFGMFETIRAFAREQLSPDDPAPLRHAAWYAGYGDASWRDALFGPEGLRALTELSRERGNLEAACRWATREGRPELAAAAYLAVAEVLMVRGPARAALDLAEELLGVRGLRLARAEVLFSCGAVLAELGRPEEARQRLTEAIRVAQRVEDPELEGQARTRRAMLQQARGRSKEAMDDANLAVKRLAGASHRQHGVALANRAALHRAQGRIDEGLVDIDQALALLQHAGDAIDAAIALGTMGNLQRDQGAHQAAEDAYRQALALHRRVGNKRSEAVTLANLTSLLMDQRRFDEAREAAGAASEVARSVGLREVEDVMLARQARIQVELGRTDEARPALVRALQRANELGDDAMEAEVLEAVAALHLRDGRVAESLVALEQAEHLLGRLGRAAGVLRVAALRAKTQNAEAKVFRRLVERARADGAEELIPGLLVDMAEAHLSRGQTDPATSAVVAAEGLLDNADPLLEARIVAIKRTLRGSRLR